MIEHFAAFLLGVLIDWIVGDPHWMPHPIRLMGRVIALLDKALMGSNQGTGKISPDSGSEHNGAVRNKRAEFFKGMLLWVIVVALTLGVSLCVCFGAYRLNRFVGIAVEAVLTAYCLAAKSLKDESMKVSKALLDEGLAAGRKAVSMIVGRDVDSLDEAGVIRAAVETVAENTSDGVIAPMIYCFIGGPVLGLLYKAVNTMDSMLGYHNDRYEYFGKVAAKMDDVFNFLPSRISAILMILAAFVCGRDYSGKEAFRIFRRDRYNHKSPNSAQTESALAGALSLRLAGDASYFGKIVKKPYIGDDIIPIENQDIARACRLMYATEVLCIVFLGAVALILYYLVII